MGWVRFAVVGATGVLLHACSCSDRGDGTSEDSGAPADGGPRPTDAPSGVDAGPREPRPLTGGWREVAGPTLVGVYAVAPNDVRLLAQGRSSEPEAIVETFDGTAWTDQTVAARLRAIHASAPDDAWAAGIGAIWHWDGSAWSDAGAEAGSMPLNAFAATSASDVWLVGDGGLVMHYGGGWVTRPSPGPAINLTSVCTNSADDVWAGGRDSGAGQGVLVHWNGTSWSMSLARPEVWSYDGLGCFGRDDVRAVGGDTPVRWNGMTWTDDTAVLPAGRSLAAIWGATPDDVWAAGTGGSLIRWNGSSWSVVDATTANDLVAIHGTGANDVWIAGNHGTLRHWNGTAIERVRQGGPTADDLLATWTSGATDAWAFGDDTFRWDGTSWRQVADTGGPDAWGSAPDDVWAGIVHWDGMTWMPRPAPDADRDGFAGLDAIWGTASNDVWATQVNGASGYLLHWNGTEWTVSSDRLSATRDVWAWDESTAWAVGSSGHVVRWDGMAWTEVRPLRSGETLDAVWGSGPDDIWAIGAIVLHWDGTTWTEVDAEPVRGLSTLWGTAADHIWAAGTAGRLAHFDGVTWTSVPSNTTRNLHAVSGSGDEAWAVGEQGTILRYEP